MKNILFDLSDSLLAQITRKVLTSEGKVIIDEETIGFLYQRVDQVGVARLFVVDSDLDFMEVREARLGNHSFQVMSPTQVLAYSPELLEAIDPEAFNSLQVAQAPDDLDS